MKLLIITQSVDENDPVLGFFHGWMEEFIRQSDQVTVIGLNVRAHHLPKNVRVLSFGKESGTGRLTYLWRLFWYSWKYRNDYDSVFVHMNQIYVAIAGLYWRAMGKRVGLWYAHGSVTTLLKIAEKFTNFIFTSTPQSFRLPSKKLQIVGQGIDIEKFSPSPVAVKSNRFTVLTVGRISPVKDYGTLISAAKLLTEKGLPLHVQIIGGAGLPEQELYLQELKAQVATEELADVVSFEGSKTQGEILPYLQSADLFVNMSLTGSLDKAILEALACGLPTVSCNDAMVSLFTDNLSQFQFEKKNPAALAERIQYFSSLGETERADLSEMVRGVVVRDHSLPSLVSKILKRY